MFRFVRSEVATLCIVATWLCACLLSSHVSAQVFSPTLMPGASPIVVTEQDEKAPVRPKVADQRLVNIAFGATVNAGNSRSYAGNLGGRFGLIRSNHQVMVEALGTLGAARQGTATAVHWTTRNVLARARYDLFVSQWDALFVAIAPRRDKFAGLDLRLQNQVGYLRNLFFPVDAHRFWTELGYDFTYDAFSALEGRSPSAATMTGSMMARPTPFIHSARLFFGYTNRLSQVAAVSVGMENLFDFVDKRNVRVSGLVELTSSITHTFKLGLQSRLLFDNVPVKDARKVDAVAVAQLVYTFDSNAGTALPPCPVCDCTAQVQAARAAACRALEPKLPYAP